MMRTCRNVLAALSCLALFSAGGRPAPPPTSSFCGDIGCAGGELECFVTILPAYVLCPPMWQCIKEFPVFCYEPSRR